MKAYVITRSEEHADYVEVAFYKKEDAEDYCKFFNKNENEYHRNITEISIR